MSKIKTIFDWFMFVGYIIATIGMLVGVFFQMLMPFAILFVFLLALSGLFQHQTLNIFFQFSQGLFSKFWGMAYLISCAFFAYIFYLASLYEKPKTIMELIFGTEVQHELLNLIAFMKNFIIVMIIVAILELIDTKLTKDEKKL